MRVLLKEKVEASRGVALAEIVRFFVVQLAKLFLSSGVARRAILHKSLLKSK